MVQPISEKLGDHRHLQGGPFGHRARPSNGRRGDEWLLKPADRKLARRFLWARAGQLGAVVAILALAAWGTQRWLFAGGRAAAAITATVTRNTPTTDPLVVTLAAMNSSLILVPATVTIPAGQSSVTFQVKDTGAFSSVALTLPPSEE